MSLKKLLKIERSLNVGQNKLSGKPKIRNLSALTPLLKKGGIHDKNNPKTHHKKDRKSAKLLLKRQAWF